MDHDELRSLTLLLLSQTYPNQIKTLMENVARFAAERGFYPDKRMPKSDRRKVLEVIHEFLMEGILMWGSDADNPEPPFLGVTEFGVDVLKSGEALPYDPEGYLKRLQDEVPNLDPVIKLYVGEALHTFLKGNMLASTVMLGGASEKVILLLIDCFSAAINDPTEKASFDNEMKTYMIGRKFEALRRRLEKAKGRLPRELAYGLDVRLSGVFEVIRTCRNDVGHPTGRKIDRKEAFTNLQLFRPFCKFVYELIDYFNKNRI